MGGGGVVTEEQIKDYELARRLYSEELMGRAADGGHAGPDESCCALCSCLDDIIPRLLRLLDAETKRADEAEEAFWKSLLYCEACGDAGKVRS